MKNNFLAFLALAILLWLPATNIQAQVNTEDSLALVAFYETTNGNNWTNNAAWKTELVSNWFGVTVLEGQVTELRLPNNNLTGTLPYELVLNSLNVLDLANNNISGDIPNLMSLSLITELNLQGNQLSGGAENLAYADALQILNLANNNFFGYFPDLTAQLTFIDIRNNNFDNLPSFAMMTSLTDLLVENNNLTFMDLDLANVSAANFTYSPQNEVELTATVVQAAINNPINLEINKLSNYRLNVEAETYQWYKDGSILVAETTDWLEIISLTAGDIGMYHCVIKNSMFANLELTTQQISVEFLSANAGKNDTVCFSSTYLSANDAAPYVGTWSLIAGSAVFANINDPYTQVSGLMEGVNVLRWSFNGTSSDVSITKLVDLSAETSISGTDVSICETNHFLSAATDPAIFGATAFGYWVESLGIAEFTDSSSPNSMVSNLSNGENILFWNISNHCSTASSSSVTITVEIPVADAGMDFQTPTNNVLISNFEPNGSIGSWTVSAGGGTISSPSDITPGQMTEGKMYEWEFSNLVLGTNSFVWTITNASGCMASDELVVEYKSSVNLSDSLSLLVLYNATNGDQWFNNDNWKTGPVSSWYGVSVDAMHNVTAINLLDNNLEGAIPMEIGNFQELAFVDLSYNMLSGAIPTTIENLSSLNEIIFSYNNLETIPQEITNLSFLEYLALDNNNFSALPNWGEAFFLHFDVANNNLSFSNFTTAGSITGEYINWGPQKTIPLSINQLVTQDGGAINFNINTLSNDKISDSHNQYQWFKDGEPLSDATNIIGSQTANLQISNITAINLGIYSCEISNQKLNQYQEYLYNFALQTTTIDLRFLQIDVGVDQSVCAEVAQLKAMAGSGIWNIVQGSATIENSTLHNTAVMGLAMGVNIFEWTNTSQQKGQVTITRSDASVAIAGPDQQICTDYITLSANSPTYGVGSWSITSGTAIFSDVNNPTTMVTNLGIVAKNTLTWSITNGTCVSSDDVFITSNQVIANAGADTSIYWAEYPIPLNSLDLSANELILGETGNWTIISGLGNLINETTPTATIADLSQGTTVLRWTLSNTYCTSFDEIKISTANFITNAKDTVSWTTASDWFPAIVPTINDSVSIQNCFVKIFGTQAFFKSLRIGNGALVYVKEDFLAKTFGKLSGGEILIQQDVEKGNAKVISPQLRIGSGGEVLIQQDVEKASNYTRNGLRIGSGGEVLIQQDVEKGSKYNPALLTVMPGKGILISETNPAILANATLLIKNGGQVNLQTSLVKNSKFVSSPNLAIGSGGEVLIQQDVEKGSKINPAIRVGSGGHILIQQDVEKSSKAINATLRISGGEVLIQQDVEKTIKAGRLDPNLLVRNGGDVIIEPSASTGMAGSLVVPVIKVAGGLINLGSAKKALGSASISTGEILIQQDVEKSKLPKSTPDMTVATNGSISFFEITGNPSEAFLTIGENIAISFMDGSNIAMPIGTTKAMLLAEECSSLIDPLGAIDGTTILKQSFKANSPLLISSPVSAAYANIFSNSELGNWGEMMGKWKAVSSLEMLNPMSGFRAKFPQNDTIAFVGHINRGLQTTVLSNTTALDVNKRGFNMLGNPFTAAIDWELSDLNNIETAMYTYNPITENFGIYQKGGFSLNGADQYIDQMEGFFVKATPTAIVSSLGLSPESTVHNIPGLVVKTQYKATTNGLKLSVNNATHSDQILLRFHDLATMAYDETYDVFKFFAFNQSVPQLYTLGENMEELAMNVSPTPLQSAASKVIPLNFKSGTDGSYTLKVDEYTLAEKAVYLKDLKTNTSIDLRTTTSYQFDWVSTDLPERFELSFFSTVGIDDLQNSENTISIYSYKNKINISINELELNTKVEVYNISGTKIVDERIRNNGVSQFAINYASGTYFVRVISNNKAVVQKVFITQ